MRFFKGYNLEQGNALLSWFEIKRIFWQEEGRGWRSRCLGRHLGGDPNLSGSGLIVTNLRLVCAGGVLEGVFQWTRLDG